MRMERLELSKQKLLGPKSSASTNFATSANLILVYFSNPCIHIFKMTN
mgnify:CR=1 FL=1|jgi:hypothetical protein